MLDKIFFYLTCLLALNTSVSAQIRTVDVCDRGPIGAAILETVNFRQVDFNKPYFKCNNIPVERVARIRELKLDSAHLGHLNAQSFEGLISLNTLALVRNFHSIANGSFRDLSALEHLTLDGDVSITREIMSGLVSLKSLQVHRLESPGALQDLKSLQRLKVGSSNLAPGLFVGLDSLELLEVENRPGAVHISLGSLKGLRNLEVLVLHNVGLESIAVGAFDDLENLKTLKLSGNRLTEIEGDQFRGLRALEILGLRGSEIQKIAPYAFRHLGLLRSLDLDFNDIESLPSLIFSPLVSLEQLNFQGNCKVRTLDPTDLGLRKDVVISDRSSWCRFAWD